MFWGDVLVLLAWTTHTHKSDDKIITKPHSLFLVNTRGNLKAVDILLMKQVQGGGICLWGLHDLKRTWEHFLSSCICTSWRWNHLLPKFKPPTLIISNLHCAIIVIKLISMPQQNRGNLKLITIVLIKVY